MIPRSFRAVTALSALALVHSTLAIDFAQTDINPLQCGVGESCSFSDAVTQYKSVPPERVAGVSADVLAARQQQLFEWLSASQAPVDKIGFSVELSRQDLIDIGEAPSDGVMLRPDRRRFQVGVDKQVDFEVRFDSLHGKRLTTASHMGGAVAEGLDGELVWTAQAYSKGATALRIGIEELDLPAGAELYVYSDHGEAFGPYTGRGPSGTGLLWTNTIMGERVNLQLHYAGSRDAAALTKLGFRIGSISHIGSRFPLADFIAAKEPGEKTFCGYNEHCVLPGNQGGPQVADAKEAVALILFSSQGGTFVCSGGLIADTDTSTKIPYFLTANHCISKGREANSVEAVFDFAGNVCDDQYGQGPYPRVNGSSIKSSNRTSDYTLLELDQAPAGTTRTYLGWTNVPVANSNGVALYRISHPSGAPQAYSAHEVDVSKPTCGGWPRGNWIYSRDTVGATEGGSSGSPVVNGSGQVVGQLTGACGFNVGDVCDADSNATVDGAFAAYFSAVEPFLDPGTGGGCQLGQKGAPCNVDADCCSNKCKGPTNNKTCK